MRYKEYNANRVLEKSIPLFWSKGFNGCSINEIVEATGVNRFSLYHEFNNKEGILYQSLKLYKDRYTHPELSILESKGALVSVLQRFYLAFLQESRATPGCYIIHIGTELADIDTEVREFVDDFLKEIQQLLVTLLCTHGYEVKDAQVRARHLLGLYCTSMSFCLIHTASEREKYILNGIKVILS